jgi:hypothetical protein
MSEDLRLAALMALEIPREACKAFASRHSIRDSAADFFSHIAAAQLARRM